MNIIFNFCTFKSIPIGATLTGRGKICSLPGPGGVQIQEKHQAAADDHDGLPDDRSSLPLSFGGGARGPNGDRSTERN